MDAPHRRQIAPQPRVVARQKLSLGDMLQRLAIIAPNDLQAVTRLVRDVLKHAEKRYKRYYPNGPSKL